MQNNQANADDRIVEVRTYLRAYYSFGGEVEASTTPTICRLPDLPRHQLSTIARKTENYSLSISVFCL